MAGTTACHAGLDKAVEEQEDVLSSLFSEKHDRVTICSVDRWHTLWSLGAPKGPVIHQSPSKVVGTRHPGIATA